MSVHLLYPNLTFYLTHSDDGVFHQIPMPIEEKYRNMRRWIYACHDNYLYYDIQNNYSIDSNGYLHYTGTGPLKIMQNPITYRGSEYVIHFYCMTDFVINGDPSLATSIKGLFGMFFICGINYKERLPYINDYDANGNKIPYQTTYLVQNRTDYYDRYKYPELFIDYIANPDYGNIIYIAHNSTSNYKNYLNEVIPNNLNSDNGYYYAKFGITVSYDYNTAKKLADKISSTQAMNIIMTYADKSGYLVDCAWYAVTDLVPNPTKTYTNTTWNTSKTWYIKTTFSRNPSWNVVNYETSMLQ